MSVLIKRLFKTLTPLQKKYLKTNFLCLSYKFTSEQVPRTQNAYEIAYEQSTNPHTRESFWFQQSKAIDWFSYPSQILDKSNSNPGLWRWFKDAQLNMCHNCIDRHLPQQSHQPALNWYSAYLNQEKIYTYKELHENVNNLSLIYQKFGLEKDDVVIIYMPMIPEAVFGMLACSRIGVLHSVVFGGFAAQELANRIIDCKPKLILTASVGIEPQGIDYDYESQLIWAKKQQKNVPCVQVNGDHPLYILYTSGTTGTPKGIVRDTGGTAVALCWSMKHIMDIEKGDSYFASSDIGWVVGHSFIVYGPLLVGASTVLYEGKPNTPNPGALWRLVENFKVKGLFTAPTALRAMRRDDPQGIWIQKYDVSSLTTISIAGERCDVPTYNWIKSVCQGVFVNDNYWQTESGWQMSCNFKNLHTWPLKPGSVVKPVPGYVINILDENNQIITAPGKLGKICVKLPMPPSFMLSLYNNEDAFIEKYLKDAPGYYQTGDSGYYDIDGYLNVMSRIDDIINTAGHRLSTGAIEESLLNNRDIVEAAVVAKQDKFKGEIPVGFVVLKEGLNKSQEEIQKECVLIVRKIIGPVASFNNCILVEKLPKTRSGKVLRNILKKMVDNQEIVNIPPTIEDASVLKTISKIVRNYYND
ncbi:hypothetical protein IMG5_162310 [Ichthyophthirius multifiliis]|uniref:Propionate--CoA ligase n=1 Tax=Ichthyophthirius multifiliis TaxID=5932 RepID=G0R068_ICHMU|nr:hypothetical protein IMG5_162310 [Ichthyophthirius multifiliis]EGR29128.1 hypothetical protein IMG5_162310 [Ichthyophthirius multifiliis]|eukprot:XP_004030364.1 hypothetical protein IMG5_162310 [Ichthyophthirius multifiliis]